MASLSKLLYYTCYEAAHTWNPSCSSASLEVLMIGFKNGFKIYAVVYLLSALVTRKKLNRSTLLKLLKDNVQSACFLSVNAGMFVAAHCFVRSIFQHINYISAAYIPGFIASYLAILVERKSRRGLLALYVTNVASECVWNILVSRGHIKPLPYGEVLLFSLTMALFGFHFKKKEDFSPFVKSLLELVLGKNESAKSKQVASSGNINNDRSTRQESICLHPNSCWKTSLQVLLTSFGKGYALQAGISVLTSLKKILAKPSFLLKKLTHPSCLKMGLFFAWFSTSFQAVCCLLRRYKGKDSASNSAIAGAVAGLGLAFNPSTSLALYAMWKGVEAVCEKEQKAGRLPSIPGGVEILYGLSTAYLFHLAIMENFNLKPSYWRFLLQLTDNKVGEVNRYLLYNYGLDSARFQVWPKKYESKYLTESFKNEFAHRLKL